MKKVAAFVALCAGLLLCVSCQNTNSCLQKYGYTDCDNLKAAFNLQNNDEAIKYHDIKMKCGCKE
jgi:hypothetical protein